MKSREKSSLMTRSGLLPVGSADARSGWQAGLALLPAARGPNRRLRSPKRYFTGNKLTMVQLTCCGPTGRAPSRRRTGVGMRRFRASVSMWAKRPPVPCVKSTKEAARCQSPVVVQLTVAIGNAPAGPGRPGSDGGHFREVQTKPGHSQADAEQLPLATSKNLFERGLDGLWCDAEVGKPGHRRRGGSVGLHEFHLRAA